MNTNDLKGKKLLILGANAETVPLVEAANEMGVKTIVTSNVIDDIAKKIAWKSADVDGMDVPGLISLAREEEVDGVLVGVADVLVPAYCKVCDALELPCYATEEIINVFSYKDIFKTTLERFGIHGVPEYIVDEQSEDDYLNISFPVMVKPVDSCSGIGMTVCYSTEDLKPAITKAKASSKCKRYIIEEYMDCDDVGIYYMFKDGKCRLSCIFDRYTSDQQKGVSKVSLGGIYPSKHIDEYYERFHDDALRCFKSIGIKNGVLLLQAFFRGNEFYVYDTGFRLQGEAPHIFVNELLGFDHRKMLVNYALTGSEGYFDIDSVNNPRLSGKSAATLWFLLKKGEIKSIRGLDRIVNDAAVIFNGQRMDEGDKVKGEWIGTEKQVLTRLYIVCDNKMELCKKIKEFRSLLYVEDRDENSMLLDGLDEEIIVKE